MDDDFAPEPAPADAPRRPRRSASKPLADQLPASEEAERQVIGCCLLDSLSTEGHPTFSRATEAGVSARSFYWPANALVWETMESLSRRHLPLSVETVAEELMGAAKLAEVGGIAYLMQITQATPTTAQAAYFIGVLREKHVLRELAMSGRKLAETALTHAGDPQELLAAANAEIQRASDLIPSDAADCAYDHSRVEPEPPARFRLRDTIIATPGNLVALYSQAKTGKTAFLGAMLAAVFREKGSETDCLGVQSENPDGLSVVHFDTEQSRYDYEQMIRTALERAKMDAPPAWFHSYHFTGKSASECRKLAFALTRKHHRQHGGTHSVFIDGVADLVVDPNDSGECFPLITELHALSGADGVSAPVITVLHQNPGSENEKGRGHLGSQLERKAQSNLTMKVKEGTTHLWATKQRGKPIPESDAVTFKWDDEAQMHLSVIVQKRPGVGGRPVRYDLPQMLGCLSDEKPATFAQFYRSVRELPCGITERAFRDVVSKWVETGEVQRVKHSTLGTMFIRRV